MFSLVLASPFHGMTLLLAVASLAQFLGVSAVYDNVELFVDEINAKQDSWLASVHRPPFTSEPYGKLQSAYIAAKTPDENGELSVKNLVLPPEFDARKKFKACARIIGHVRYAMKDQANCGSCAAMAAVGSFNDRLCIKRNFQEPLSAAYVVSCCTPETGCPPPYGCDGGNTAEVWDFAQRYGIPTGGGYPEGPVRDSNGCWPYFLPKCAHVPGMSKKYPQCPQEAQAPACQLFCPNTKYKRSLAMDRHYVAAPGAIIMSNSIEGIKAEVYTNGSVTAGFELYQDFIYYKSGVYKYVRGKYLAVHAVKLIGWGKAAIGDYWLAVNSWNEDWGEGGLFRIAMGQCRIEDLVVYGNPQ
ncbi:hypothetical protein FOL47_008721 [Perkinsus chesapeaki]|uniref:Peptidase C1A papain C-terminal domain-containing protein n=1 Tax=Perkinsus chesapeaki TaxID=330153 RepID=A0A7J6LC91_PERCH|nr:hypothetical protein FOL47_008721 [Perkinsus chesapeaki]